MTRQRAAASLAVALATACGPNEPAPESPRSASVPSAGPQAKQTPSAPASSPGGSEHRIQDLIGRKLDQIDRATCADPRGFQLERGLMLDGRALAVRSCERFRGPHDLLDAGAAGSSKLTIISDGGRIVFAVASKEYDLERARRVSDALMNALLVDGCEQVHSTELAVGFSRCPGRASWAAISRVELVIEGGSRHAVVLEIASDRGLAGRIAAAYAEPAP
jgi:hypothetical protein